MCVSGETGVRDEGMKEYVKLHLVLFNDHSQCIMSTRPDLFHFFLVASLWEGGREGSRES